MSIFLNFSLSLNFDEDTEGFVPSEVVKKVIEGVLPGNINYKKLKSAMSKMFPRACKTRDGGGYIYRGLKMKMLARQNQTDQSKNNCEMLPRQQIQQEAVIIQSEKHALAAEDTLRTSQEELIELRELKKKVNIVELRNGELCKKLEEKEKEFESSKKLNVTLTREKQNLMVNINKTNKELRDLKRLRKKPEIQLNYSTVNHVDPIDLKPLKGKDGKEIELGEGTFGRCILKTFNRTGNVVVCKEMKYDNKEALIKEAQIMQLLTGRAFPYIYGVQLQEKPYSIVMQFIYESKENAMRSVTLAAVLDAKCAMTYSIRKAMTNEDWKRFALDLVEGIKSLHEKDIIHNDLKCDNILIANKRGCIVDYGKACFTRNAPAKKYSIAYSHIAPEVLKGRPSSKESDIYSLGKILNKMKRNFKLEFLDRAANACLLSNSVMRPAASNITQLLNNAA